MNLVQIADYCEDLGPVILVVKSVFGIIQFGIPIILILFGAIDLGKAVISSDEKEVKQAQGRLIKRCIYAVAVFFIVLLVTLIMNIVGKSVSIDNDGTSWSDCWRNVSESNIKKD